MRKNILIICLNMFLLGSSSFLYATEEKNAGEVFYNSVVNRSMVKTTLKWTDEEASVSEIDDFTEKTIFSAKVADFFTNIKPTWKEAWFKNMKIRRVSGFNLKNLTFYNFNKLQNVQELINPSINNLIINQVANTKTLKSLEKEISRIGQLKILDYEKKHLINKLNNQKKILLKNKSVLSNTLKKTISNYSKFTEEANRINRTINLDSFKSIKNHTWNSFKGANVIGKSLTLLGVVSVATDITFAITDSDKRWGHLANGGIHLAQLVPIVGLITAPVEITMNFSIDYYENYTDEISGDFGEKINFFDEIYLEDVNRIDRLFQENHTAEEYRDNFYNNILHGYVRSLIGDKHYWSSAFTDLKDTTVPHTDFFTSILSSTEETIFGSNDFKKAKISGYEMVSDYYLMRIPIYFDVSSSSLPELSDYVLFQDSYWSENDIRERFITPLLKMSQQNGYEMVSFIKNELEKKSCNQIFNYYFHENAVGKDIYNTTLKNCKENSWKRGVTELWLISRFEKKLRIKKYNDWNVYLQRTLWENRLRKIIPKTSDIQFDTDNYLNLSSYSQKVKNSLEEKDLEFFKKDFNLNTQVKIYNQKWSQLRKGIYRLYDDVPFNHTFYNYINTLSKKNLISNINVNYRPQDNISQYEALKIIENLLFKNEFEKYFEKIEDENKNKTKDEIELLKRKSRFKFIEEKVTKITNISFNNEIEPISRGEIAELIIQVIYKKVKNKTFVPKSTEDKVYFSYLDKYKYKEMIDYTNDWNIYSTGLKAFGISMGYKDGDKKGQYGLSDNITRGEIAKIFIKTAEFIKKEKGEN